MTSPMRSTASARSRSSGSDERLRMTLGGDRVGKLGEPPLAPRDQQQLVAVLGEDVRERRPDARGRAGDQRDRPHVMRSPVPRIGRHAVAQLDPVARGDAEQVGGPPDQVVLEFGDAAVRVDHFPHHLDHAPPSVLVERAVDQAGEVIEIDRLVLGFGRLERRARRSAASSRPNRRLIMACSLSRSMSDMLPSMVAACTSRAAAASR